MAAAPPICAPRKKRVVFGQLSGRPAEGKAKEGRQGETVQHLDPFSAVDAAETAVQRDGRAGQAGDQGVAFAGGNAEIPSGHGPQHNGEQCGAQGDGGLVGIATEVHHVVDGLRDGGVDQRHDQHPEEVAARRH